MVLLEALMGRPPPFYVSSFQGPSLQLALFWSLACPPTVPSQTAAVPTKAVITEGLARRSALAAGTCLGKCGLATPPHPPMDHWGSSSEGQAPAHPPGPWGGGCRAAESPSPDPGSQHPRRSLSSLLHSCFRFHGKAKERLQRLGDATDK